VWPMGVVVVDVDRSVRSSCLRETIRSQSRQSRRTVPTQRSANAFAFGARNGVRMISRSSLRKTSSNARVNLLSRSWIRKRAGVARSGSDQASCRACWANRALGHASGDGLDQLVAQRRVKWREDIRGVYRREGVVLQESDQIDVRGRGYALTGA
jgi:hypothetical protein